MAFFIEFRFLTIIKAFTNKRVVKVGKVGIIGIFIYIGNQINLVRSMSKKEKDESEEPCCPSSDEGLACCHVEGIAKVDGKGQIVLPKSLRDSMNIEEGDKLVVVGMRDDGELNSISLFKANRFDNMVKILLKPVMEEILEEKG